MNRSFRGKGLVNLETGKTLPLISIQYSGQITEAGAKVELNPNLV